MMKKKGALKRIVLRTIKLLKQYIRLPHIITLIVIIIGTVIMCSLSIVYHEKMTFCHRYVETYLQDWSLA